MLRKQILLILCFLFMVICPGASRATGTSADYKNLLNPYNSFANQNINHVTCRIIDSSVEEAKSLRQFDQIGNLQIEDSTNGRALNYSKKHGVNLTPAKFTVNVKNTKDITANQLIAVADFNKNMKQVIERTEVVLKSVFGELSAGTMQDKVATEKNAKAEITNDMSVTTVKYTMSDPFNATYTDTLSGNTRHVNQKIKSFGFSLTEGNASIDLTNDVVTDTLYDYVKITDNLFVRRITNNVRVTNNSKQKASQSNEYHISYKQIGQKLFPYKIRYQSDIPSKENVEITLADCKAGFSTVPTNDLEGEGRSKDKAPRWSPTKDLSFIMLPSYKYTSLLSNGVKLTAEKKETESKILIEMLPGTDQLESFSSEKIKVLKSSDSTIKLLSEVVTSVGDIKAVKIYYDAMENDEPIKGILLYSTTGKNKLEIKMSCPASVFPQESVGFEKTIQTLKLL